MGPEEPDDDAEPSRPVPHPDDRLWRHPSELSAHAGSPGMAAGATGGPALLARSGRERHRALAVALVAGMIGAALAVTAIAFVDGLETRIVEEQVIQRVPVRPIVSTPGTDDSEGIRQLLDQVQPTVVEIEATSIGGTTAGSGVLFRDDGYILTSAELVADAGTLGVWMSGRRMKARLVGADAESGIAVVKIDGRGFPTAVLGSTTDLAVGEPAIVIDFSAHDEPVAAIGRVRAINQQAPNDDGTQRHGLIETDTPVHDRSDGAPLWNGSGVVVGIVTQPAEDDAAAARAATTAPEPADALDFATGRATADAPARALAIDIARTVAEDLIEWGSVRRVWLGVDCTDTPAAPDHVSLLAASPPTGVSVYNIAPGSPAEAAGLVVDDVIVAIDRHPIESASALVAAVRAHHPGDRIKVTYARDGEHHTVVITLAKRPS